LKHLTPLFAAGSLMLVVGTASAITIDEFSDGLVPFPGVFAAGPNGSNTATQTGSGILGGSRDITVQMLSGNGSSSVEVRGGTENALFISNGVTETSEITVLWDDMSSTDLTDLGKSTGLFLGIPTALDNDAVIGFTITGGGNTGSASQSFADGAVGSNFFLPFSAFSGGINFQQVTSIALNVTSDTDGFDGAVNLVETRPNPVPVPGTLALLGLGFVGFGARRRLKRA
jgi:hypothetical protein